MEAITLNCTYRETDQLCLQVYDLVHKSHTITYEHEKHVNITKQVKNNVSLRKMELTTIKRISKLNLNRHGRWAGWENQKHQDGVNKANLCGLERSYDQTLFRTSMTVTITFSNIQLVRNKENELLEYLTDNNFDACILTETWLKDTDEHVAWVN